MAGTAVSPRRLAGTTAALLKRARTDAPVLTTITLVIAVTAATLAGLPRHLARMSDEAATYLLRSAPTVAREVRASLVGVIPPADGDPIGAVVRRGESVAAQLPDSVSSLLVSQGGPATAASPVALTPRTTLSSPKYVIPDDPPEQAVDILRDITLRYQTGLDEHIRLAQGRFPAPTAEDAELLGATLPVVEVAVSTRALGQLQAAVGELLFVTPDLVVLRTQRVAFQDLRPLAVRIVGAFDVLDPEAPYWHADADLARAREYLDGETIHVEAYGLVAREAYPQVLDAAAPVLLQYHWRWPVDIDRVTADDLGPLADGLRRVASEYGNVGPTEVGIQTGLASVVGTYRSQRAAAVSVLAIAAIGLTAVLLTVLLLAGLLGAQRRRDTIELVRSRGASVRQVLAAQAAEGSLLAAPAALAGAVVAAIVLAGGGGVVAATLAGVVAVAAVAVLVFTVRGIASQALNREQRQDVPQRAPSPRRLVAEAAVVVVAGLGTVVLRRRGLADGADPFLAAVPVLLGLAAGLVTLRLYPLPLQALARAAARRPGLSAALGLRRAGRQPSTVAGPLLVVLLAVAVGTFTSVITTTVQRGQRAASWHVAGAPYRLDAAPGARLHSELELADVPGVAATAPAWVDRSAAVAAGTAIVELVGVDLEAYLPMLAGTPADPDLPEVVRSSPASGAPIPVVLGGSWAGARPEVGDQLALHVEAEEVSVTVAAVRERFPTVEFGEPYVIASLESLRAASGRRLVPTRLYLDAPTAAGEDLTGAVRAQTPSSTLLDRAALQRTVAESPFVRGVLRGFGVATTVAVAAAVLAVALGATATGRARRRDLAVLRSLGMGSRQGVVLAAVELVPPTLVAVAVGVVLGILTMHVTAPGIALSSFTGPGLPVQITTDAATIGILAGVLVAATAVAVTAISAGARHADLDRILRTE